MSFVDAVYLASSNLLQLYFNELMYGLIYKGEEVTVSQDESNITRLQMPFDIYVF